MYRFRDSSVSVSVNDFSCVKASQGIAGPGQQQVTHRHGEQKAPDVISHRLRGRADAVAMATC